jgi:[NiFe] hydrogenase diaphorase moiety small subunit
MTDSVQFKIDGKEITAQAGQTILQAADAAGVYIPRLCAHPDLRAWGSCRVCLVKVNGRAQAACTQPVAAGAVVENDTPELTNVRRALVEMLFVEGNHVCPACEKSGNCELQATAYRLGIASPRFPYAFPHREVDASHPDVLIERNRCILCARCVRASEDLDGKGVFEFVGRGSHKRLAVNAQAGLAGTNAVAADRAFDVCPVGCLVKKRVGFAVPVGQRRYDQQPIGSEVERGAGGAE